MPFPLPSNLAGIAKGVALNGVLPYIVAKTIFCYPYTQRSSSGSTAERATDLNECELLAACHEWPAVASVGKGLAVTVYFGNMIC